MLARPPLTSLTPPGAGGRRLALCHRLSTFLLAAAFLYALGCLGKSASNGRAEACLLLLATAGTLLALARQLPTQNVFLAALIIAGIGSLAHAVSAKIGLPFGQFMFGAAVGPKILGTLPWAIPLLWVVAVLNSRGVARLILRPWRKIRAYGAWLIAVTVLLTVLFDCALEPFAVQLRHYWIWAPGGYSLTPQGAPVANSLGWFIVTLLCLAFVTPALINKQLSKRSAPDFHPLAVWLGCVFLFAVAAALNGLWPAVAVDAAMVMVTTGFALRGAWW